MSARRIAFLAAGGWLMVLWSQSSAWGVENAPAAASAESQSVSFGVFWPPEDPWGGAGAKARALLNGLVSLSVQNDAAIGWTASLRIVLSRPADEAGRAFWNSRLAFPEYDWMSTVRIWDADRRWLWPNLAYLLRLHGKERVDRYGGVDPGKGVDNDFAAVLIRKCDATGQSESEETKDGPLVAAEWYPVGTAAADKQTVVHTVQSDEFRLQLGRLGEESRGHAGIWLIYADFLGAKVPAAWPKEPEFAGGILAFFEARWILKADGGHEIRIEQMVPRQATGFDWERWTLRTRAYPDSTKTAKLSDRGSVTLPSRQANQPTKVEEDGPANGSQPIRSETNRTSPAAGSRR